MCFQLIRLEEPIRGWFYAEPLLLSVSRDAVYPQIEGRCYRSVPRGKTPAPIREYLENISFHNKLRCGITGRGIEILMQGTRVLVSTDSQVRGHGG